MTVEPHTPLPRVRFVEALPIEHEGRMLFLLRDPSGYAPEDVSVSAEALFIIQHLDGKTTPEQLAAAFQKNYDQAINIEDIRQMVDVLDENFLIDSERFAQHKKKIDNEFIKAPARPFTCFSADDDPQGLRKLLNEVFQKAGFGPGPEIKPGKGDIAGIIAPHIDYQRGRAVYGFAYGELFTRFDGDTIIIIGTNHQGAEKPIILTDKDFETPFGTVRTDADLVAEIAKQIEGDPFADQIAHRKEHWVELAATMISYANRHESIKIVPILVSRADEWLLKKNKTEKTSMASTTIRAIRAAIQKRAGRIAVIASADLAHVGRQFGDPFKLDPYHLNILKEKDEQSLELVCRGDAKGFASHIADEQDERRTCGLGPIYVAVSALEPVKGRTFAYDQWVHPDRIGTVTFAAVVLEKQ